RESRAEIRRPSEAGLLSARGKEKRTSPRPPPAVGQAAPEDGPLAARSPGHSVPSPPSHSDPTAGRAGQRSIRTSRALSGRGLRNLALPSWTPGNPAAPRQRRRPDEG